MILETTQLLYTAHWVLAAAAGLPAPDFSDAPLRLGTEEHGYLSIKNNKHPCAIWVRESLQHYRWLCWLGMALCEEFQHRYGRHKAHSCEEHLAWLVMHVPPTLKDRGWSDPPQAMPDEHKKGCAIAGYRAYYRENKQARGFLLYTGRHRPHWLGAAA